MGGVDLTDIYRRCSFKFKLVTCHMEDRLEAQTKATNFHWVLLLDAVVQHANPCPVLFSKEGVIVGVQCWPL